MNAAARLAEAATLPETDIVRDAAIQRFEFTFELVWKTLQLYLEHEGLESSGPHAVLKRAFVMRLIPDQDEADVWLRMFDDRNLTSHAYDETLAVRIYTRIVHDLPKWRRRFRLLGGIRLCGYLDFATPYDFTTLAGRAEKS